MEKKEKTGRAECLELLRKKHAELAEKGENRYPKRSDFSSEEVEAIKAYFGPWPRALEAAGIKPPRSGDRIERNREKRIRAKRARNLRRKQAALEKTGNADDELPPKRQ